MRWTVLLACLTLALPAAAEDASPELRVEQKRARRILARAEPGRLDELQARLQELPSAAVEPVLLRRLASRDPSELRLVARELGRRAMPAGEPGLTRLALEHGRSAVRAEARAALAQLPSSAEAGARAERVLAAARSGVFQRVRAIQLVGALGRTSAMPGMIRLLRQTAAGGRVHITRADQRAYVQDVEVNNTGVIPVLNPVVGRATTGSQLETKVIFYLREKLIAVMEELSDERLGDDADAWEAWWGRRTHAEAATPEPAPAPPR